MTFQPLPQSPKASQPDSVTATVSSNLTSRRQRVSRASRWKVPVFSPARWRQQRAKPSQGTFSAVSLEQRAEKSFAWTLLGHLLSTFALAKSSGFISDPCSRADSQLKKGRSPPRPLRPLARGEQTPRSACRPQAGQGHANVHYFNGHLPTFVRERSGLETFRLFSPQFVINGNTRQAAKRR